MRKGSGAHSLLISVLALLRIGQEAIHGQEFMVQREATSKISHEYFSTVLKKASLSMAYQKAFPGIVEIPYLQAWYLQILESADIKCGRHFQFAPGTSARIWRCS